MAITPEVLVSFGSSFAIRGQTVTLTAEPGPTLPLRRGTLTIADPWWPEHPEGPVELIGAGEHPTLLSTIAVRREGRPEPVVMACAVATGQVDQVVSWQPSLHDEEHFHLDTDSALGAFFDVVDEDVLRPLFEDALHMQGVYHRALEERLVTMEVEGRVVAAVFLCPDGSGLYPAYVGYDVEMKAVASLVDLKLLDDAT